MRVCLLAVLVSCVLACAGCDSLDRVPSRVRERFEAPEPQVRVYEVEPHAVFEAAQATLRRMDFRIVKSGAAQGVISAVSRLQPGDSFGIARQYAIDVRLGQAEPQRTSVSVVLREQEESTSFAGATDIPVREHGIYDSFFAGVAQELAHRAGAPAAR